MACKRKCGYTKSQFIDESATLDTLTKPNCGENATYMSDQAAEDFQVACANVISKEIEKEIQQSRFLSVLVDESADISVNQKLVVCVY